MEQPQETAYKSKLLITLTDSPEDDALPLQHFSIESLGRKVEQKTVACSEKLKRQIRTSPLEAVGIAAAAGFLSRSLPLTSIIATAVRVVGGFGPPVLLALGAVKLFENRRPAQIASSAIGSSNAAASPDGEGVEDAGALFPPGERLIEL
jgi:hypothetical protein